MENQLRTEGLVAFVISLSNVPLNSSFQYRNLTKVITATLLTNFTFVLWRISEWQFLIILYYTELLLSRHSEYDRTIISSRTNRSECLEKLFLEIFREEFPGRQT